jgi:hypothetical protein
MWQHHKQTELTSNSTQKRIIQNQSNKRAQLVATMVNSEEAKRKLFRFNIVDM